MNLINLGPKIVTYLRASVSILTASFNGHFSGSKTVMFCPVDLRK